MTEETLNKPIIKAHQKPSFFSFAVCFIVVVMMGYICHIASDIMIPLVVAVFVWYLLNAITRFLGYAAGRWNLEISKFWRLTASVLMLFSVTFFIYELVHSNIDAVIREAPKFQESLTRVAQQTAGFLSLDHTPTMQEVDDVVGNYIDIGAIIRAFAAMLTGIAGKTLMVFFFVGFLLYEQRFFDGKLKAMIADKKTEKKIQQVLHTVDGKIQKYIGVKASVSFLDSILTFSILSGFGVDFAGFWGVMAFFLHFIPYAGSVIAISLPVMVTMMQFGDLTTVFMVLGALCLSHAFLGHVLDPYMMGNNLNLSPIVIITNLAMWGMIWGVPGMFLAIPILAIATITMSQFETTRPLAVLFSKTGEIEATPRLNVKVKLLKK